MLLRRFYDDSLAQASYLLGCDHSGEAVVIDATLDVAQYVAAAEAEHLRIAHVTETHIHADYVSGSRALAARTGARLHLSGEGDEEWRYGFAESDGARLLRDGDRLEVGRVRLEVLHTPGHTPEHVCFVVTDTAAADRPMGVVTGDFLFVGDVGRPDLLERAAGIGGTMDASARRLWASLRRLDGRPDYLQLWPGHGAGSACGKALGAVPTSTLGYERIANWAFQVRDEETFVREVLAGQPEPPRYFAAMKRINRDGPPTDGPPATPPRLDGPALDALLRAGAWVLDTRPTRDFTAAHLPGTLHVPAGKSFTTWAGSLVPPDVDVALLTASDDEADASRLAHLLAFIGLTRVVGWAGPSLLAARALEPLPAIAVETLAAELATRPSLRVIDVRSTAEWRAGHLPGATHLFLGTLSEQSRSLPRDAPIVVHCQGGTRSAIAASLLRRAGFADVTNLPGGYADWVAKGRPVTEA